MLQKYIFIFMGVFLFCNHLLAEPFSHAKYDSFLVTFASQGRLNYPAAKASPRLLREYIAALRSVPADEFETWPESEKITFWINAYNVSVIQGVLLHYPLDWGNLVLRAQHPRSSVFQIKNFDKLAFIKIKGEKWPLKRIRTEIIAKKFHDSRLFFTLVSGRMGDPPLPDEAYSADKLENQLNRQLRQITAKSKYIQLNTAENKLLLAPVFAEFQHRIQPPANWQAREESHRDSLKQIQQDSVRQLVPALVAEAYQNYKMSFDYQKKVSTERLIKKLSDLAQEISAAQLELKTNQPPGGSPDSDLVATAFAELSLDATPVSATRDSVMQQLQIKLDSLEAMENHWQDSLQTVQSSEIDSVKYWQNTSASLLADKLAQLPPIPALNLAHYPQAQQGIVALVMDYAPAATRQFLRKNYPVIEFLPLKKELNEIVY